MRSLRATIRALKDFTPVEVYHSGIMPADETVFSDNCGSSCPGAKMLYISGKSNEKITDTSGYLSLLEAVRPLTGAIFELTGIN